ncbi:MAG: hypothetical protein V3V17_07470 [Alphaproteobacteria bacterium]
MSAHLLTNAWVIERFGLARVTVEDGVPALVTVEGAGLFAKGGAP